MTGMKKWKRTSWSVPVQVACELILWSRQQVKITRSQLVNSRLPLTATRYFHEMSVQNDDKLPASYKYAWTTGSDISLKDFLIKVCPAQAQPDFLCRSCHCLVAATSGLSQLWCIEAHIYIVESWFLGQSLQFKPSMVQNDGSKPVRGQLLNCQVHSWCHCCHLSVDLGARFRSRTEDRRRRQSQRRGCETMYVCGHGQNASLMLPAVKEVTEKVENIKVLTCCPLPVAPRQLT